MSEDRDRINRVCVECRQRSFTCGCPTIAMVLIRKAFAGIEIPLEEEAHRQAGKVLMAMRVLANVADHCTNMPPIPDCPRRDTVMCSEEVAAEAPGVGPPRAREVD